MLQKLIKKKIFIPLFLILITFITYLNILPNKLFYDDEELIYKNAYVSDLRFFPRYFTSNMIAGAGKTSNMYRPVLIISFAIDRLLWGNNPLGYHLTSILLQAINGILIFLLISYLFKNRLLAFLTSVLFIIHPVQSEAVVYASGRTDPLMLLFCLSSILLLLKSTKTQNINLPLYSSSIFLFLLAVLSKEIAVILPFLVVLAYFTYMKLNRNNLSRLVILISPFLFLDAFYVLLRLTVLNFADTLNFYSSVNIYNSHLTVRLFTFTSAFLQYVKVLIFPKDLIFSRDITILTSVINPTTIVFIIILTVIFLLSVKLWGRNKLFLFSTVWFFIGLIPVSGIIPINNIVAEHYLYLPSVGFFLFISYLFTWIFGKSKNRNMRYFFMASITVLIAILSTRTIIRAFDWRDAVTFYTVSLKQSPGNIPMQNNLAMTYADMGQLDLAVDQYKTIITQNDIYPNTHHNLGNIYKQQKKYEEAEKEYLAALKMDPKFYFSYYALTDLYQKTDQKQKLDGINKIINRIDAERIND